jgi:hypothetical protein
MAGKGSKALLSKEEKRRIAANRKKRREILVKRAILAMAGIAIALSAYITTQV